MKKLRITLYVKGVKTVTGIMEKGSWGLAGGAGVRGGYRIIPDYKYYREVKYKSVLPEDQKKVVQILKAAALNFGFKVKIIDVTKENFLHRLGREKIKQIRTFPTLVTDRGDRIEGQITEEQIKLLLSKEKHAKSQLSIDLSYLR